VTWRDGADDLPRPVPPHDAHTHTTFSDGRNSVLENVRAAEAVGLECVAVTDHIQLDTTDLDDRLREIQRAADRCQTMVLPGAEATVLDPEGHLSISPGDARRLRFVLADFGGRTGGIATDVPADPSRVLDNVFRAYENVVKGGVVHALAHPFNLGRFQAVFHPDDLPRHRLRELARLMFDEEVAFEIMDQMYWWYPDMPVGEFTRQYAELLRIFSQENVKFVVGSDAHSAGAVGNSYWCRRVMRLAGVELSQLVDLRSLA
jgi:putative hydrolase